jgi:hypothetical protein
MRRRLELGTVRSAGYFLVIRVRENSGKAAAGTRRSAFSGTSQLEKYGAHFRLVRSPRNTSWDLERACGGSLDVHTVMMVMTSCIKYGPT